MIPYCINSLSDKYLRKYNVGGYASGTDIKMNLSIFVFDCLTFWFYQGQSNDRIHQRSMDLSKASQCIAIG